MLKNYSQPPGVTSPQQGLQPPQHLGLAIGMAVALLIGLWVYNEYSYDTFLPDHLRIYQLPPAIVPSL